MIKALLAADSLDRLSLTMFPQILGGGERLFDGALSASTWSLTNMLSGGDVLSLSYDRNR